MSSHIIKHTGAVAEIVVHCDTSKMVGRGKIDTHDVTVGYRIEIWVRVVFISKMVIFGLSNRASRLSLL